MACPDRGAGGRPRAYSCLHERCLPSTFATSPWAPQYRLSPTRSHAHSAARSSPSSRSSLTSPPGSSAACVRALPAPRSASARCCAAGTLRGRIRCTPPALCTCEGWPDMRGRRSGVPLFGYSYVPNRTTLAMTVCAPAPSHMDALATKPMA